MPWLETQTTVSMGDPLELNQTPDYKLKASSLRNKQDNTVMKDSLAEMLARNTLYIIMHE